MGALKVVGIGLVVAGALGLVFTRVTFTKAMHEAKLGPIELSLEEKETVNVPTWASVGMIVIGGGLAAFGGRRA